MTTIATVNGVPGLVKMGGTDVDENNEELVINKISHYNSNINDLISIGPIPETEGAFRGDILGDEHLIYVHVGQNYSHSTSKKEYANKILLADASSIPLQWSEIPFTDPIFSLEGSSETKVTFAKISVP